MKRYRNNNYSSLKIHMVESPNGEWVKYKDALKWNDVAFREGGLSAQQEPPAECNCVEKHEELWRYWICPAHGYKKR